MDDLDVLNRISALVEEEHGLLARRTGSETSPEEHARLAHLEVQLDQCWDLLRQRRARRAAGEDPSGARPRDEDTVEHYKQ
jgi:hypothetical protein